MSKPRYASGAIFTEIAMCQHGTDPGKLAQIAYGLLPRDVFISVEQRTPGNLDPDEWAILRRVIDLIQQNAKGAELGPVLETIEQALRSDQAKSGAAGVGTQRRPLPTA